MWQSARYLRTLGGRGTRGLLAFLALCPASNMQAQNSAQENSDTLHRLNESVDRLIHKVSPSVVQILVTGYGPLEDGAGGSAGVVIGRQRAIGSGFVIDPDGYILTNAHVVSGAQRVQVVLPGSPAGSPLGESFTSDRMVPARILGVTREIDLAVLKIESGKLPALPLAAYRDLRQGELVFAMGSPGGLRNTVTMGIVSQWHARPTSIHQWFISRPMHP